MNWLSINLKGAGGGDKPAWVKELRKINKVAFLALQETQMANLSDHFISKFWGNSTMATVSVDSVDRSGGIISVWDPSIFSVAVTVKAQSYILTSRTLVRSGEQLNVLNVYAPNDFSLRRVLWEELTGLIRDRDGLWLAIGDFNEVSWICKEGLEDCIEAAVAATSISGGGVAGFAHLLKTLKFGIKKWRAVIKDKVDGNIKSWEEAIDSLEVAAETRMLTSQEKELRSEGPPTKNNWIRDGDENSYYFHAICNTNKGRGRINGLVVNGVWIEEPSALKEAVKNHFKKVFAEPIRRRPSFQNVGLRCLSESQAAALVAPFTGSAIKDAVWCCDGNKAPGPDGFTIRFLKQFWDKLKPQVLSLMEDFHGNGVLKMGCNPSFIVLLPKVSDPIELGDYRPISLIGLLYKIVAKVLANRLKPLLRNLVSLSQSAFVGSRNILDGPLVVSEVVSWAKKSKTKIMLFKADFAKAYDSLNWKFLLRALEYMRFPEKWTEWVAECLKSGMGSVILNGSPTGEFRYKRGLRQGDPLSPSLFILALEVLDMFMNRAKEADSFGALAFSLVCNINPDKSKVFGVGVSDSEINDVASIFNCGVGTFPFTYLGLPIGANMKRVKHWEPIINRFHKRLNGWKAKTLSFAGRVTLAKSVLGSLSSYFLGVFKAPKAVLKTLEGIRRKFVWGQVGNKIKICWYRWNKMLRSKRHGGLGMGGLESFNLAMVAKWWWRIREDPKQLWARVIAAIHGPVKANKMVPLNKNITGWWKDIAEVDGSIGKIGISIKDQLGVKVGNRLKSLMWFDNWVGCGTLKNMFPNVFKIASDKAASVSSCFEVIGESRQWRWGWSKNPNSNVEWAELGNLMSLLHGLQLSDEEDQWVWTNNLGVQFSTKSIRDEMDAKASVFTNGGNFRWNAWAPLKDNYHAWRAESGKLAAKVALVKRGIQVSEVKCSRCSLRDETTDHMLADCIWARSVWWNVCRWVKILILAEDASVAQILNHFQSQIGSKRWKWVVHLVALCCLWRLWIARNNKEFNGIMEPVRRIVDSIKEDSFLWVKNRVKGVFLEWKN
ncbi:uncharacterized protein LOC110882867 [Helianthus annuus]|uniref:uncharacterized protein LOC110882867 n=1 Tax=Helianthus annuus TaxID=4232 RepID=UPI000B8F88C5|nr:uncharacterized protein LOC110882867 [Helianthus annuus]